MVGNGGSASLSSAGRRPAPGQTPTLGGAGRIDGGKAAGEFTGSALRTVCRTGRPGGARTRISAIWSKARSPEVSGDRTRRVPPGSHSVVILYLTYRKLAITFPSMNGTEIKALRKRLRLTQEALANAAGVSANTVARWERGELGVSSPMVERLQAVAESLPSGAAITRSSGVILDSHHRAILDGLERRLDPEVFEACAVALLRKDWPGLVPVRGGRDDGFDGAVAHGTTQEPFPLVVTTSKKLVNNLEKNLDSTQRAGWTPQRVLFATSRNITPATRCKLYRLAREKGVTLIQTYDRDWFAGRLYREPAWSKRLLRVTGSPHALSAFPLTQRPVLGDVILGREQEMRWLLAPRGDCLLVGEPGSGKTFLLRSLAAQGEALFLVDEDREQIVNDLRSLQPNAVIVDDAHVRPGVIENLVQLRREMDAEFRIVATCWPGEAEKVRPAMGISRQASLELDRIDADTIIEIIKLIGLTGPDRLLYIVRKQAAGRPGLAATLAHLCLIGDVRDAVSGEGLVDHIAPGLDNILGLDSARLLAPFALGGNAGAKQEDVAKFLGKSLLKVSSALAKLGAAGIIRQRHDSALSVEPSPMRWVLVRRVFFGGAGSLPVEPLLALIPNRTDAFDTLIGAYARGARIPGLEQWLEEENSTRLWSEYASLGPGEAGYVLDRHPELIGEVADSALMHFPQKAIPMLLTRAGSEARSGTVSETALRPFEEWIERGSLGWEEALKRRQMLLKSAEIWWRRSRDTHVAIAAMCTALNPRFDFRTHDPGAGRWIKITKSTLRVEAIVQLTESWAALMTVVNVADDIPWANLFELLWNWSDPRLVVAEETRTSASSFIRLMLTALASASRQYPGVQHRLGELANQVGQALDMALDMEFECLYPPTRFGVEDRDQEQERLVHEAHQLAEHWGNRPIGDIAEFLRHIETEARRAGMGYPRLSPAFCEKLAAGHPDPTSAAKEFMQEDLPADLVEPFVREAVAGERPAWQIVADSLHISEYATIGIVVAISHRAAPSDLVSSALAKVGERRQLIEHCCLSGDVSEAALLKMLRSGDTRIAIPAAIGHWQAALRGRTNAPVGEEWRQAFLLTAGSKCSDTEYYWIGEILAENSDLATSWVIQLLDREKVSLGYLVRETARKVSGLLSLEERRKVLEKSKAERRITGVPEVVQALVGDNHALYCQLLDSEGLKPYHLAPLIGRPDAGWREKAVLALNYGFSCDDLVEATLGTGWSWNGNESEMWAEFRHAFEALRHDNDSRIVSIGKRGAHIMSKREESAQNREREEAVHGVS